MDSHSLVDFIGMKRLDENKTDGVCLRPVERQILDIQIVSQ
jgi:hypothetical protein